MFEELFAAIDRLSQTENLIIGIDGMCVSGKSTLARLLGEAYNANVFHADDFFLPPEMRTESRLGQPGGNMHRERLLEEVLIPLSEGRAVTMRPFDCGTMTLTQPVSYPRKKINIVEGSYCHHPDLRGYYSLTVALKTSPDEQLRRLGERNPERLSRFEELWIPMENKYFAACGIFEKADMVFET